MQHERGCGRARGGAGILHIGRTRAKMKTAREKDTCALAATLWREACEARETIVQDYLFGRGFTGEAPRKRQ